MSHFSRARALGAMANVPAAAAVRHEVALYDPKDAMATLTRMAHFVDVALGDPYVIDRANAIIAAAPSRDWPAQIRAIRQYLERAFYFVDNPIGKQRIQPVALMLERMQTNGLAMGACNDAADLVAAVGMANGLPARFVAYAFCESRDGIRLAPDDVPYSHVIADLFDGAQWVKVDVTRPMDLFRLPCVARTLGLELA